MNNQFLFDEGAGLQPVDTIAVLLRETAAVIQVCRQSAADIRRTVEGSRRRAMRARLLIDRYPPPRQNRPGINNS